MRKDFFEKSKEAANFYFQAYSFLTDLSLLMDAIVQELVVKGYNIGYESYGLPFTWAHIRDWRGNTPACRFALNQEFFGRFYRDQTDKNFVEAVHHSYGIFFKAHQSPDLTINPWIPFIYFLKAKLITALPWDFAWNQRILTTRETPPSDDSQFKFIRCIRPSDVNAISDLAGKIEIVQVIRIPLGAVNSTEDVRNIVPRVADALVSEDESNLEAIADFLARTDEIFW